MQGNVNIYRGFSRRMRFMAMLTGFFIALAMPVTYFILSWADQKTKADFLSRQISQKIVEIVKVNPELWKYTVVK